MAEQDLITSARAAFARRDWHAALMGGVAGKIAQKFRTGGGLGYEDYPDYVEIQAADSASVHERSLVSAILPLAGCVDGLRLGLRNVRFQLLDAAVLDGAEGFDLITVFDAIRDQAQPAKVLQR